MNARCLGLHKSPGALAARARAASVAGSRPVDEGEAFWLLGAMHFVMHCTSDKAKHGRAQ